MTVPQLINALKLKGAKGVSKKTKQELLELVMATVAANWFTLFILKVKHMTFH